ncbi:MAG: PDR/VanB family oxidoreductase [Acinetobacter sp.]
MQHLNVIVDAMSRQGEGNIAIKLVAASGEKLPEWQAGAHIDVHLPNNIVRQYSLTGHPQQSCYLICVKKESLSRGGSKFIHEQLRIGQTLKISLPRQAFPLLPAQHHIFMAAGIGITPILAMLETLEAQQQPFQLFYYVKQPQHVAFAERWLQGFQYGQCSILCSEHGQSARHQLPECLHSPQANQRLYLCGPESFMLHCQDSALQLNWQQDQIHLEAFAPMQQHTVNHQQTIFTVKLSSTGQCFDIPEDRTIAQVLIEHDINVPLSCEMGMCGACLTRVYTGEVDHQDTVQTEDEKNAVDQFIALCCSRAKSAMIEIDL